MTIPALTNRANKKSARGFTLLEVLIALAILAISSLAIISQSRQSLSQLDQLQLKTTAVLVADNQLALLQMAEDWPRLGRYNQTATLAQRQWLVSTDVNSTSDPLLRQIVVTVSEQTGNTVSPAVLAQLTAYRGRY